MFYKKIIWINREKSKGKIRAIVSLEMESSGGSYETLLKELQRTFPRAQKKNVSGNFQKAIRLSVDWVLPSVQGITWSTYLPKKKYRGYKNI